MHVALPRTPAEHRQDGPDAPLIGGPELVFPEAERAQSNGADGCLGSFYGD